MPILELCAGYGGLGMAVEELTGDKVAYVAEVDEAASKILAVRYPDAPNIGDITKYDWTQLEGLVDIITAGFPCQDISNAGKRKGIEGERSGIWKNVCEAVGILRPRLVFLENVAAIRGRGLSVVSEDLAGVGYDLLWTTLRASEVGPPPISDPDGSDSQSLPTVNSRWTSRQKPMPTFPTPWASDGPHGGPNQRNSKGQYDALPEPLLKTPTAQLGLNGAAQHPEKRKGGPWSNARR